MQSTITRLALFQIFAVLYSTLGVGTFVRITRDVEPPEIFASLVRDYGFLLFALPVIWLIAATIEAHRPKRDTGDSTSILFSGVGLLVGLIVFGLCATFSATRPMTHVIVVPQPTPVPARLRSVLE